MKIMLLSFLFMSMYHFSSGQIVMSDVDLNTKSDLQYLVLDYNEASAPGTKNRRGMVSIDYGQDYDSAKDLILKDEKGEYRWFNSLTDVLNFFFKNGWKYCDTYAVITAGGSQYGIVLERIKEK
jgi:hypothetical protein